MTQLLISQENEVQRQSTTPPKRTRRSAVGQQASALSLLDNHVIESELQHGYPRQIRALNSPDVLYDALIPLILLLPTSLLVFVLRDEIPICLSILVPYLTFSAIRIRKMVRRWREERYRTDTLRYGAALPAVVYGVPTQYDDNQMTFVCRDASGNILSGVRETDWHTAQKMNWRVGDTFTVLVSPRDGKLIPYFDFFDYEVLPIPATIVSQNVSTAVHTQAIPASTQPPSTLGLIEPELLQVAPRALHARPAFWYWWCISLVLTLIVSAFSIFGLKLLNLIPWSKHLQLPVQIAIQSVVFFRVAREAKRTALLREGIATRARVRTISDPLTRTQALSSTSLNVVYEYEEDNGKLHTGTILLPLRTIWQRGITEGATFTVLYSKVNPENAQPYFTLDYIRLLGAITPKVTPP